MKTITLVVLLSAWSISTQAQTPCDYQQNELRKLGLAAKYEQLPESQRSSFFSQLSPADQISVMGLSSGHNLGAGLNNAAGGGYSRSITDLFHQKSDEFRKKCGFMLR
jgi:hypothetical protein